MQVSVTYARLRHVFRVGACPVLEVTVIYPCLKGGDPAERPADLPSVLRFNQAYRRMAEGILRWSGGAPLEEAEAAFRAGGPGAGFRFDRRLVICEMTADVTADTARLRVSRVLRVGSRRGEASERFREGEEIWRLPELTLCRPRNPSRFSKNRFSFVKISENP